MCCSQLCSHCGWLLLKCSAIGIGFNGAETNCRIAHILGILLMNSCNTDRFLATTVVSGLSRLKYIYIDIYRYIYIFIIWQAPRAGSMQRILCSDWLSERARWNDTARPGLPVSFPQIKFRQSSSECTKVFFSPKLLSAKVKRFFVISLSLWNRKKRQRE